jgi:hypothetical protein
VLNTAAKISYEALHRRIDQVSAAIAEQKAVQENHARVVNQRLLGMEHRIQATHNSMLDRMNELIHLVQQQTQAQHQQQQQYQQQVQQLQQYYQCKPQHRGGDHEDDNSDDDDSDETDETDNSDDDNREEANEDDARDFHSENGTDDGNHDIGQQQAVAQLALPVLPVARQRLRQLLPQIPQRQLQPVQEALLPVGRVPSFDTNMPRNIVDLVATWRSMGMEEYRRVDKNRWPTKYKIAFGKFQYLYDMATHDRNNVFIGNNPTALDLRAREMDQSRVAQRSNKLSVAQFYTMCKNQDETTRRRPNRRGHDGRNEGRRQRARIGDLQAAPAATMATVTPLLPAGNIVQAVLRHNTLESAFNAQARNHASYTGLDRG